MDDDWGEYYFWEEPYPEDDSIVTLPDFVVNETPEDPWNDGGAGSDETPFPLPLDWGENFDPDDWEYGLPRGETDPTAGILAALNDGNPGWEKVNDTTYKNPRTGQTYSTVTEKITTPRASGNSSTNPAGGTRTGGSSTNPGGSSGGSGGSQSGAQSGLDKALAALGALANAFTKVSGAVQGTPTTTTTAAQAAAAAQQKNAQMGKIILGAAAGIGLLLYLKTRKK